MKIAERCINCIELCKNSEEFSDLVANCAYYNTEVPLHDIVPPHDIEIEIKSHITYEYITVYEDFNAIEKEIPAYIDYTLSFNTNNIPENINTNEILNIYNLKDRVYLSNYIIGKDASIHWLNSAHSDAYTRGWVQLDDNGNYTTILDINKVPLTYIVYANLITKDNDIFIDIVNKGE